MAKMQSKSQDANPVENAEIKETSQKVEFGDDGLDFTKKKDANANVLPLPIDKIQESSGAVPSLRESFPDQPAPSVINILGP